MKSCFLYKLDASVYYYAWLSMLVSKRQMPCFLCVVEYRIRKCIGVKQTCCDMIVIFSFCVYACGTRVFPLLLVEYYGIKPNYSELRCLKAWFDGSIG